MNCQDLIRITDSGKCSALEPRELREAEEHASSCSSCAPQWLASRHVESLAIPELPADLVGHCLSLADGLVQVQQPGRARRVTIVVGCVIALAAAAAMLVMNFVAAPSQHEEEGAGTALSGDAADPPPPEDPVVTGRSAASVTMQEPFVTTPGDIPLFPPQYAADAARASRSEMALKKLVELHPEVTQPLETGIDYDAVIQLREDGTVLIHEVRTMAREDRHWSRYDSNWGGLPDDAGDSFGDYAPKGKVLPDGRTLGADLFFTQLLVRNDYDPERSDRRVDEIMRTNRAELMLPVTETGGRHVSVLLTSDGAIEREVPGFMNVNAWREQEDWSVTSRAEAMARILGVSTEEIGLMGSVPVFDKGAQRAVFVDYAWRREPGEPAPRYKQIGWDQYTPQGVDVATALKVVERVMPDAFNQEVEIALGIPAVILTEEGRFIRTARIRSSDPREDLPGISIATFRMLVLKKDNGDKAAVYFMWQGTPHEARDPE